jgi:hypothetical protein
MLSGAKSGWANVAAGQTDNTLASGVDTPAAVSTRRIVVRSAIIAQGATASTGVTFNSKPAGSGTACSATYTPAAGATIVLPDNPQGWFETKIGEGLTCTTGTGATAGIQFTFEYRLDKQ